MSEFIHICAAQNAMGFEEDDFFINTDTVIEILKCADGYVHVRTNDGFEYITDSRTTYSTGEVLCKIQKPVKLPEGYTPDGCMKF